MSKMPTYVTGSSSAQTNITRPGNCQASGNGNESRANIALPNVPFPHVDKPKKFISIDFKRWQKKMLFYLTTLNLVRFLVEDAPVVDKDETDKETLLLLDAWKAC